MSASRSRPRARKSKVPSKSPSEIAPGVFVGGWNDATKFAGTRFCVLDDAPDDMPKATHIPIYDDTSDEAIVGNLDKLVDAMRAARSRGESVLIFCGHGVRRSPLGGAWYLHRVEKLPLDRAYERIQAVRPQVERAADWVGHPENLEGRD